LQVDTRHAGITIVATSQLWSVAMQAITYGAPWLLPEVAPLLFAAAFLAWLFRWQRLAGVCALAGGWMVCAPALDPLFARAFANLPIWVPLLLVLFFITKFISALVILFLGRQAARELFVHSVAPLLSELLRTLALAPFRWLAIALRWGSSTLIWIVWQLLKRISLGVWALLHQRGHGSP
jgi:hypothetical protein